MRLGFVACAALTLLAARPAAAKNISITLSPTVEISAGTFTLRVKIGNQGDEAAQSVTPILHFQDGEARGQTRASFGPNESFEEALTIPLGDIKPGRWPFRLTVDYTDANQYPFQALQVNAVVVGQPPTPKMSVPQVAADSVATTGTVRVRLKNLAGVARTAIVSVLVPEGLEVPDGVPPVPLAAWEEKTVSAKLVNRTALPGSRYPVYVTVEYDEDGVHQAVIAQGVVEIIAAQSFLERQRSLLWIGAAVLGLLWVTMILWRVSARGRVRRATAAERPRLDAGGRLGRAERLLDEARLHDGTRQAERPHVSHRRLRCDGAARGHLGRDETARVPPVESLAGVAVREHLVALRIAGRDDGRETAELAAEDGGGAQRVVGDDPRLDAEALGAVRERREHRGHPAGERDLGHLGMEKEPRDAEPAETRELHLRNQRRPGREVATADRAEAADRAEPGTDHGRGAETREARARGAHHAEVGQVANEGEHVRHDRPDRHVTPALEGDEGLANRGVDDGEHGAGAERVGLLAERVDLVGAGEPGDGRHPLGPRGVVSALRGPELQHELPLVRRHASTGVPAAAEA